MLLSVPRGSLTSAQVPFAFVMRGQDVAWTAHAMTSITPLSASKPGGGGWVSQLQTSAMQVQKSLPVSSLTSHCGCEPTPQATRGAVVASVFSPGVGAELHARKSAGSKTAARKRRIRPYVLVPDRS